MGIRTPGSCRSYVFFCVPDVRSTRPFLVAQWSQTGRGRIARARAGERAEGARPQYSGIRQRKARCQELRLRLAQSLRGSKAQEGCRHARLGWTGFFERGAVARKYHCAAPKVSPISPPCAPRPSGVARAGEDLRGPRAGGGEVARVDSVRRFSVPPRLSVGARYNVRQEPHPCPGSRDRVSGPNLKI